MNILFVLPGTPVRSCGAESEFPKSGMIPTDGVLCTGSKQKARLGDSEK